MLKQMMYVMFDLEFRGQLYNVGICFVNTTFSRYLAFTETIQSRLYKKKYIILFNYPKWRLLAQAVSSRLNISFELSKIETS